MTAHYPMPSGPLPSHPDPIVLPNLTPATMTYPGFYGRIFKRILDTLAVLAALPVVLPIIVVLALLVMRDGAAPFYRQTRVGRGGRLYTMWKLRSMVHGAEAILATYLAENTEARTEWEKTQKLKADPRITSFGNFLRRSSLDELPQLWNVLKGDMSLVGPRPMMPDQMSLYPGKAYYAMRPGITGPWQITERNASAFADRAHYDTRYVKELSLITDLKILVATIRVVLRGTGC